jgi:hypothetical protein
MGLDVVNEGVGVVATFGKFENVADQLGRAVGVEVDGNVAHGGFEEQGHYPLAY